MCNFLKEANSFGETRCKESWDQFEKVQFTESTLRHASIWEMKDHRREKCQSSTSAKSPRSEIRGQVP